jgi:membrane peptidoglycan carboxypeptidase
MSYYNKTIQPRFSQPLGSQVLFEYSVIMVAFVLALLLRIFGDDLPFASTIGAFAGRGSLAAIFFAFFGVVFSAGRSLLISRWPASWPRLIRRFALGGIIFNVLFTFALALMLDPKIKERIDAVEASKGFVTIESPGRPSLNVKPKINGGFIISAPLDKIPPVVANTFEEIEDARGSNRATGGVDVRALMRATIATLFGKRIEGASTVAETDAGLLFELPRVGTFLERLWTKLIKFLIGLRLSDTYTREEQIRLLANLSTFGSISGNDVRGVRAASIICYGKEPKELLPAEAAELGTRLANPNTNSPYRHKGESDSHFEQRHARQRARIEAAINHMAGAGAINEAQADAARREIFSSLVPLETAVARTRPPLIKAVFRELEAAMAWRSDRHIVVRIAATSGTQAAMEDAIRRALPVIESRAGPRTNDEVVIDAIAVDADGAVLARSGLWSAPTEQSSITKVAVLALALEQGVISSLDDVVVDRTVRQAVETSHNLTFNALVARLGPERVAEALRRFVYSADTPHARIGLGGGVTATPAAVVTMFGAFSYSDHPGCVVTPRVIAEARDAETGELLIAPSPVRIFDERVAREVRSALEGVARRGTAARELASLTTTSHTLAVKTGTSAYHSGGHLEGHGGSWIAVADSATHMTFVVRIRWQSGQPFDVEAADSAAIVARYFIINLRGINALHGGQR